MGPVVVARISLVKPEKAQRVEDMIIHAAQSGQLGGKVDEANLINLLDQISEKQQHTKITVPCSKPNPDAMVAQAFDPYISPGARECSTRGGNGTQTSRAAMLVDVHAMPHLFSPFESSWESQSHE